MGTSYGPNIVIDELFFYVDANNTQSYPGSGTTWTDLVGSNSLTIQGATWNSAGRFLFDGVDDYARISSSDFAYTTDFSVSFWFRPISKSSYARFVDYSHYGGSSHGWFMGWYSSTSTIEFRLEQVASSGSLVSGALTHNGTTWYHICGVYSPSNGWAKLYVNGSFYVLSLTSGSQSYTSVDYLTVGARSNPSLTEYSNMDLPIVMIHNKALTDGEVKQNYDAHRTRYGL